VEPADTERPRPNCHTLNAKSPVVLGNTAETIKPGSSVKDLG
jgi:hypothetical protein